ncbi:MAG: type II toxin-antitoxin system HicB family antitoxin [Gallionella sp.]
MKNTLTYPIAIEIGDAQHAFGVVVPDLPGCFSAGDTLEEAYTNAKQAIEAHLDLCLEYQQAIPARKSLDEHRTHPEYAGWIWALIEVDDILSNKTPVRLNVSLPEYLVQRIDQHIQAHHLTRSGFLAHAALKELAHG